MLATTVQHAVRKFDRLVDGPHLALTKFSTNSRIAETVDQVPDLTVKKE
jgi:hypothetical protein